MAIVTAADIRNGLEALGIAPGMGIMVHCSLSAFGHVQGGAPAVVSALMDLISPDGTILMPSFNHGQPFGPGGPGVYDPRTTPTANGLVPDTFWRLPGVLRSLDPTHPYAAWGRDARRIIEGHHRTLTMGEGSPLGLLAREGGWQVSLGTSHATTTAKHVAEVMRRVPCLGLRTESYPVRLPDGRIGEHRTWGWRAQNCPLTESGEHIEAEMERRGCQRRGRIGDASVTVFRLLDLLAAVWALLDQGWGPYPPCTRCPIRPRHVAATRLSDWTGLSGMRNSGSTATTTGDRSLDGEQEHVQRREGQALVLSCSSPCGPSAADQGRMAGIAWGQPQGFSTVRSVPAVRAAQGPGCTCRRDP
jgi:aminoglycoside 3-N-acetyltransferase